MVNTNYETKYDVFHSYLVKSAAYAGEEEFPVIKSCNEIPNRLVPFSEAMRPSFKNFDCWICFYELDFLFIRFWNNPKKYLNRIKKFRGVISCDFSLYVTMPLVMQKYHTYMGRALAHWLIENGVKVIPNVRLGDERTYKFVFDGLFEGDIFAIGTVGSLKFGIERRLIIKSMEKTIEVLKPKSLIIYGSLPKEIEEKYPEVKFYVFEKYQCRNRGEDNYG